MAITINDFPPRLREFVLNQVKNNIKKDRDLFVLKYTDIELMDRDISGLFSFTNSKEGTVYWGPICFGGKTTAISTVKKYMERLNPVYPSYITIKQVRYVFKIKNNKISFRKC